MAGRESIANALAELRADRDRIDQAIAALEPLVSGNGARPAVEVRRKKIKTDDAQPDSGKKKRQFHKHCDECGTNYIGAGPRTPCPKCNPRIVSAKDVK